MSPELSLNHLHVVADNSVINLVTCHYFPPVVVCSRVKPAIS